MVDESARGVRFQHPSGVQDWPPGGDVMQREGDERQRRGLKPNTTCSLKKARRLRGCCTWVQAGSGRATLATADAHLGTTDVLYLSKCDPD